MYGVASGFPQPPPAARAALLARKGWADVYDFVDVPPFPLAPPAGQILFRPAPGATGSAGKRLAKVQVCDINQDN